MPREMICINCPIGCRLTVDDSDKNNIKVSGNTCPRGTTYAVNEVTSPKRMVTGSVRVTGGTIAMVSVKTREAIPKQFIFESLDLLKKVTLSAPVKIGDVVVSNICGCGVDFIATKNVDKA
ncbi:MAG: DUF1667 domain-containing protein [Corallococcus sp.]|nr:DUF1667 domain-containing protein [Corallococcus sp.]MCM1359869.1 DUF1667 domain-containing protein [Corallococcus sp.]MCM1395303.1 DUF1667 domain-containing protein [Corallococcus sp.]